MKLFILIDKPTGNIVAECISTLECTYIRWMIPVPKWFKWSDYYIHYLRYN